MVEDIYSNKKLIAQLYNIDGLSKSIFPTPPEMAFQFGFGYIENEKSLIPHIHKDVDRNIKTTSEFLYVISGSMKIDIYDEQEVLIKKITLKSNNALLQFCGGHKIYISKNTKYFELKQGPYLGRDYDKYEINKR